MIKKSLYLCGLAGLMLMSGCQTDQQGQTGQMIQSNQQANGPFALNQNRHQTPDETQYGYTRFQRQQVQTHNSAQHVIPTFDRNQLADAVTRIVLTNQAVDEAATLVTDKYVLVTYNLQDDDNREYVADQVKRSAVSVVPRYYDVFISDNHEHFQEIERFQNRTAALPDAETLRETIEEMKQSPQGAYDEQDDENLEIMEQKQQRLLNHDNRSQ
ncbi:YhcN/YlaJ family sporulation lipoprotein [Alkalihalobacillus oceani]|uniref:YhcN/YlaJ family sporulation lipoprotein n=1 Tax=Halalkalibacter oceani TaxID=1653776 RepID=UPI00203D9FE1|nr:YhcN/YlaJ family sporulation lipoprotein [Halalkalibacter oceani]MCM3760476.1 YhcN/YlaJ family sporulation lipoprotein [Halalkalibacter oceani]